MRCVTIHGDSGSARIARGEASGARGVSGSMRMPSSVRDNQRVLERSAAERLFGKRTPALEPEFGEPHLLEKVAGLHCSSMPQHSPAAPRTLRIRWPCDNPMPASVRFCTMPGAERLKAHGTDAGCRRRNRPLGRRFRRVPIVA